MPRTRRTTTTTGVTTETRRFGVEIEFVGISQGQLSDVLSSSGIPVRHSYSHSNTHWSVKSDGSVHGRGGGGELVSPPLSGRTGLEAVKTVCRTISRAGATANRSCGLHVHVEAVDLTGEQMANIVRLYREHSAVIRQILAPGRRNNHFCQINPANVQFLSRLAGASSRGIIENLVRYENRYQAVNLCAFARHGTIEFRQHQGTTNAAKVSHWIRFCLALVEKARSMTPGASVALSTPPGRTRGRPPNYADRRALWALLRDGLADERGAASNIGHSLQTTRRWIRELVACGAVMEDSTATGCYRARRRISAENRSQLNVWLGENAALIRARTTPVGPRTHTTLFEGMSAEMHRYYTRRAAAFGFTWN